MRTLLRARLDTHTANEAVRNGTMGAAMRDVLEQLRPEAAYFTCMDGGRTCILVFDMRESSEMPALLERFFLDMEAEVELHPVMNADDLREGLEALPRG
ncbi:hypothetical protein J7W19_00885 [Streptomyces mobaraensis NBRC 13819 = DSM 40847]|uniref:DUF3303 domain-containing protein n=1 Tax=Streptomyces mobaraensis TaxID=35621 RepID=A0A5N5VZX5_STRMB|nr:hypothetical protein [Streptomyces mobaraensis]KAB7833774.1 hypothetical protein FRZ00_32090 [Streptomyces mobaraensis]QTT72178.1 hypothetical protein J7W19_00885 [Streptomyces mobaraensis NBRC 13819 = DSM 40847]